MGNNVSRINSVYVTELAQIGDHRGAVLHMIRSDDPGFIGFGEVYFSEVMPGVVKGWKLHKLQTQNIAVPVGRVQFVLYDGRDESSTHGVISEHILGRPDKYHRLTIPPGVWYGFKCISGEAALLVNCSDLPHDPSESVAVDYLSGSIPYTW